MRGGASHRNVAHLVLRSSLRVCRLDFQAQTRHEMRVQACKWAGPSIKAFTQIRQRPEPRTLCSMMRFVRCAADHPAQPAVRPACARSCGPAPSRNALEDQSYKRHIGCAELGQGSLGTVRFPTGMHVAEQRGVATRAGASCTRSTDHAATERRTALAGHRQVGAWRHAQEASSN